MQPTRGLDIGATEYVRQRVLEQRSKGWPYCSFQQNYEENPCFV